MCALASRGRAQDGGGEDVPRGVMVGAIVLCGGRDSTVGVLVTSMLTLKVA